MSAESSSTELGRPRALTAPERGLLARLLRAARDAGYAHPKAEDIEAQAMADGGMGSLRLHRKGEPDVTRRFGRRIAEIQFDDVDGVAVIASLNVDEQGELYEMDVWKTDFSPTVKLLGS